MFSIMAVLSIKNGTWMESHRKIRRAQRDGAPAGGSSGSDAANDERRVVRRAVVGARGKGDVLGDERGELRLRSRQLQPAQGLDAPG